MAIQRKIISMNAKNGDFRPKNITDQHTFKTNCIAKNQRAILAVWSSKVLRHKRKREIPINTNRVIQTGENTQFGGLKDGFSREAYHVGIEGEVNKDPITPANWQITRLIISFNKSFFPIFSPIWHVFILLCRLPKLEYVGATSNKHFWLQALFPDGTMITLCCQQHTIFLKVNSSSFTSYCFSHRWANPSLSLSGSQLSC